MEGEEVVVVAEKPMVRKDLTSSESRVQASEIERMPVETMDDILNLQAGITRGDDGNIHIRGGRSSEVLYIVNGVSVTDDYSRDQGVIIDNESIKELQVVSGTFNAEYGNAMSGIVNVVTKTGGNKFKWHLDSWVGDYISNRSNIFWNIDNINMLANNNSQASISGPIINNKLTYFVSGKRYFNDGYIYGANAYNALGDDGDSSAVSMNSNKIFSGQFSLNWYITKSLKYNVDWLGSLNKNWWYSHIYRLNPNGLRNSKKNGETIINSITA